MEEQELKEHVRRAKVAQRYVLLLLIGVCLGTFFYVRSIVLEESEEEIPLVRQEKGLAAAVVFSSYEVKDVGGRHRTEKIYGFGGAGVFYVGDKRYFCDLETLQVAPPVGLFFPVYYSIENPKINQIADIPVTDSIMRNPVRCWGLQQTGAMQLVDTVRRIDKGIYEDDFSTYKN